MGAHAVARDAAGGAGGVEEGLDRRPVLIRHLVLVGVAVTEFESPDDRPLTPPRSSTVINSADRHQSGLH
jgi:hypothetical protein